MPPREELARGDTDLPTFLLLPGDTVAEALRLLAEHGLGIGLVVDGAGQFLGTLTDGDIRRGALAGCGMETPVSEVMSSRLIGSLTPTDRIPEVLARGRLLYPDDPDERRTPRTAVIMAGGRGERLRPLTDKVPKPLLKVGARSIVERLILGLAKAGVEEVFLAVNYMAEVFEQRLGAGDRLGVTIRYLREEHAMGTAGALSLLPPDQSGPLLVANGDILTTLDFSAMFDFHWRHRGAITVAGVEYPSAIPYGVLRNVEHHLLSIDEKPERRDLCSAGIYILEPDVLRLLAPKEAVGMPDLIADVLAEGRPVNVFPILEGWYDIGETAQFERVLVQFAASEED